MVEVQVAPERVIAHLRRRLDEREYEVAVLSAVVDQQQEQIDKLTGGGYAGDHSG